MCKAALPPRVPEGLRRDAHARIPRSRCCGARTVQDRGEPAGAWSTRTASGSGPLPAVFEVLPEALPVVVGPDAKAVAMTDGLLLIHAFPLDARMWEPQLGRVRRRRARRRAAPARVRRARRRPGDVMTMGAGGRARACEALDAAGVDRAVVCGLSMGGYVAFELWRHGAPSAFAGLVLANTRAGADTPRGRRRPPGAGRAAARGGQRLPRREPAAAAVRSARPTSSGRRVRELIADAAGGVDRGGGAGHGRAAGLHAGPRRRSTSRRW